MILSNKLRSRLDNTEFVLYYFVEFIRTIRWGARPYIDLQLPVACIHCIFSPLHLTFFGHICSSLHQRILQQT